MLPGPVRTPAAEAESEAGAVRFPRASAVAVVEALPVTCPFKLVKDALYAVLPHGALSMDCEAPGSVKTPFKVTAAPEKLY